MSPPALQGPNAAVRDLQSLVTDTHRLVAVTLGVGREPRSLVFRRVKRVLEADDETRLSVPRVALGI
jgi:hypothetical protein